MGSGTFTQASASPGLRGSSSRMTRHPFPELLRLPRPVARRRQPPTASRNCSELRQRLHRPLRQCSLQGRESQRWHRADSRARRQFGVQSHCRWGRRAGTGVHTHAAARAEGRIARNRADTAVPRRARGVPDPLGVLGHLGPHESADIPQQLQTRETQVSALERRLRPPEIALFARNHGRLARAMPGDSGVVQEWPLLQMPARDRPFVFAAVDDARRWRRQRAAVWRGVLRAEERGALIAIGLAVYVYGGQNSSPQEFVDVRQAARRPTCPIANRVQVRFEE
jgi:hypothetical protein